MDVSELLWPELPWSKTRSTGFAVIVVVLALGFTEYTLGTVTIFYTFATANFDSTASGEIIRSEMRHVASSRTSGKCEYDVQYVYNVGNQFHLGKLVSLDRQSKPGRCDWEVEEIISKYPVGKKVEIYYDSENPELSVLENTGLNLGFLFLTIFMSSLLFFMCWLYGRGVI